MRIIISSLKSFINELQQYQLLEPGQLDMLVAAVVDRSTDPLTLARHLLQRGWLTAYQANQLLIGRGAGLLMGQYQLLERLGEGGMGKVFKARHLGLDRLVALKVLPGCSSDKSDLVERFRREIRTLSQLNHPNIVQAFDAGETDGTPFFVMEYVDGTNLSRLVKRQGPLPVMVACNYIRQVAQGLQHVHERGLVHRDIKPSNLILTNFCGSCPAYQVKILDLGLARPVEHTGDDSAVLTHAGTVMGTPDFLAPEQALNAHTADTRADLYSLGCTLYFLLTSQVPFPGGTPMEKLFKQRLQPAPSVECVRADVPPWLVAVVNKLLAKNPDNRYQTPAELTADLASSTCRTPLSERSVCLKTQTLQEVETLLGDLNPFPFRNRVAVASQPRHPGPLKPSGWSLLSRSGARLVTVVTGWLLAVKRSIRGA